MTTTIQKLKQQLHKPLTTTQITFIRLLLKYKPERAKRILKLYQK